MKGTKRLIGTIRSCTAQVVTLTTNVVTSPDDEETSCRNVLLKTKTMGNAKHAIVRRNQSYSSVAGTD
jgi:hypothetical protein